MLQRNNPSIETHKRAENLGCGPLIAPSFSSSRPLKQLVFEYVRGAGQCARIDVANSLGVSPASITAISNDLIASGFIHEVTTPPREGDPVRGRPPVSLAVRNEAFYVAGIKINDAVHTAVILNFSGQIISEAKMPHNPAFRNAAQTIDEVAIVLDAALSNGNIDRAQISAIGLGIPGLVDTAAGNVVWSPMLNQRNVPLAEMATQKLAAPTYIDNDANLVTLAELWFGKGRSVSDFAVVTIEDGIGMGVVLNHKIYRGAHGFGMELGHTKMQLDGALCRCGQRGCLEAYVADYALIREASTALNMETPHIGDNTTMLELLFNQAKQGDESARAIFSRAGRYLAAGLANVVNLFDPNLVILSGARMQYDYLYADEVMQEMQKQTLDWERTQPDIEIHTWGDLLWAQGAAALALSELTETLLGNQVASSYAGAAL